MAFSELQLKAQGSGSHLEAERRYCGNVLAEGAKGEMAYSDELDQAHAF